MGAIDACAVVRALTSKLVRSCRLSGPIAARARLLARCLRKAYGLRVYFLLECVLADDYEQARAPYRPEHLRLLQAAADTGSLVFAGALADPSDRSLLVWTNREDAMRFTRHDPYVANGVVLSFEVRAWNIAIGTAHTSSRT